MTTKLKAAGQRSQPGSPPAESADAGLAWRETLLRIKAAVERPDKLLTPPPLETPLPDLKRVRTLLEPYSAESSLLKSLANRSSRPSCPPQFADWTTLPHLTPHTPSPDESQATAAGSKRGTSSRSC